MEMTVGRTTATAAGATTISAMGFGAVTTGTVEPMSTLAVIVFVVALAALTIAVMALSATALLEMRKAVETMHVRRMRRNPPSALAKGVMQRLSAEWTQIVMSVDVKGTRSETSVTFADRAALSIMPREQADDAAGITFSQYMNEYTDKVSAGPTINEMRALSDRDAEHVTAHFRTLQNRSLATALGMADDDPAAIRHAIEALVQERGLTLQHSGARVAHMEIVNGKKWSLPGTEIVLALGASGRPGAQGYTLYATGPGFGAVIMHRRHVMEAFDRHAQIRMASAFRSDDRPVGMLPVFVGNARAGRLAELAQRALAIDPDLTDGSGASVRTLIEDHLPRLVERHRKASLTAETREMASVDADLDLGLDEVAQAVGEALEKVRERTRDDLREQVRFLETRNGKTTL